MDWQASIGQRVVMTLGNNLTFAGVNHGSLQLEEGDFVRLEVDSASGFCVLAPAAYIKSGSVVPVDDGR